MRPSPPASTTPDAADGADRGRANLPRTGRPRAARPRGARPVALAALRAWPPRSWAVAAVAAAATFLVIGVPTDVVPNPLFGRPVDVTWWAPWILLVTAVLSGLVAATYVRRDAAVDRADVDDPGDAAVDRPGRLAGVAGLLGFFAVGCPVCNKLVVVALGTTGAMQWFAPIQPLLAVASVVALAVALRVRLRGQVACNVGSVPPTAG